jgi:hypothetical protein
VTPNDEVERRGVAAIENEGGLSRSPIPSIAQRRRPRDRSNRLLGPRGTTLTFLTFNKCECIEAALARTNARIGGITSA